MSSLHEIYDKSVFSRFFEENDPRVLAWSQNVLEKVCSPGILPVFFNKEGEDFKAFWNSFTHLFALVVVYARQYNEIDVNKILFEIFIEERGLVTDTIDTEDQMKYLFNNYVSEYEKRGRMDIVSTEGKILGELLRLIRYKDFNEFIFALLSSKDTGWTVGYSSPLWRRTDTIVNITKGYEKTIGVENLSNYPLINPTGCTLIRQIIDGDDISTVSFVGNIETGFGSIEDRSHLLKINENLDYQVSFRVKSTQSGDTGLKFGIQIYDEFYNLLNCKEAFGSNESNFFVSEDQTLNLPNSDIFYEIKGLILNKNVFLSEQIPLNFLNGRALRFSPNAQYLSIYLTQDRSISHPTVYIYDIKVKPLNLPFQQGCIGEKNIIASYYENNSYRSNSQINLFIEQYLVSYKNIFKPLILEEQKRKNVVFKVFSERKKYISEAILTINQTQYKTDQNGELIVSLYPGEYLLSVEKEKYITISNRALVVLNDNEIQFEYISLESELYKRKVTFFVLDEEDNPLQGVEVNFNGETLITGVDGLAIFYAYPDIVPYFYSLYKKGYYLIDKSVLVLDDVVVDENLIFIPIYNVTFNVKDSKLNPVKAADVTFNEITKQTDTNGQVVFTDIIEGTYNYLINKVEYITVGDNVYINKDTVLDVTFNPTPDYAVKFTIYGVDMLGNNSPLKNAEVSFAGVTTVTNNEGVVEFLVKQGAYTLWIRKEDYESIQIPSFEVKEDIDQNFFLNENVFNIQFTVVGALNRALDNATITIKGGIIPDNIVLNTNELGQAVIKLSKGTYNYVASAVEYITSEVVEFKVIDSDQNISVKLEQKLYSLTFVVKDENNATLQNAIVKVTGYTNKVTDANGQAIFNVPQNLDGYTWEASKEYYQQDSGTIKIYSQAETVYPILKRKVGTLTINVKDEETGSGISGAQVIVGSNSNITGAIGSAIFRDLKVGETYSYRVSKESYSDSSGSVTIQEGDNEIEVIISNKTVTVTFTVVNDLENAVNGASVTFNGSTKTTNSSGQVTFSNIRSGSSTSYSYRITATGFTAVDGTLTGITEDTTKVITLVTTTKTANINIYKNDSSYSGATVTWSSYYENGVKYKSGNSTLVTGPATGYYDYSVVASGCISKSGTTSSMSDVTIYLYTAFIVSFSSSSAASSGMSSSGNYDVQYSDGYYDRLMETSDSNMSFSVSNTSAVRKIKQWPTNFSISSSAGFSGCSNLSSVASGSPFISGNITSWFYNCSNLSSVPSGLFNYVSGSDATNCFRGSGLTSVPSNLFGSNVTVFEHCFRDCTSLTSVGAPFRATSGSSSLNFDQCFQNSRLTSISISSLFGGFSGTMNISYTFANNPSLKTVSGTFSSASVSSCRGIFSSCTSLSSVSSNLFRNLKQRGGSLSMQDAFYECTSLKTVPSNCFSLQTTSMVGCFKYSGVENIEGARINSNTVTSWSQAFQGSNVISIPNGFFKYNTNCGYFNSTFQDCIYLLGFEANSTDTSTSNYHAYIDIFPTSGAAQTISMFSGCKLLMGAIIGGKVQGNYDLLFSGTWWKSLTNTSSMFSGCSVLFWIPKFTYNNGINWVYPWNSSLGWPATHTSMFNGCTNAADYSTIPSGWV